MTPLQLEVLEASFLRECRMLLRVHMASMLAV